jgi:tetratricopeptide (TPR) repeat protein
MAVVCAAPVLSLTLRAQTPAVPCPKVPHNAAADEALMARHWDEARAAYSAALATSPADPALLLGITRSDLALGHDGEAFDRASKELARDPASSAGLALRAEVLYWRGDLAEAGKQFSEAVKANHCNATAHFGVSRVLAARGYAEVAFTEFRAAHQLDAADPAIRAAWVARFGDPAADPKLTDAVKEQLKKYIDAEGDDTYLRQASANTIKDFTAPPPDTPCSADAPVTTLEQPLVSINSSAKASGRAGLVVKIDGQSVRLMLDTTANGLILNETAAARLKLAPMFEVADGHLVVAGKVPSVISTIKTIAIAGATFSNCGVRIARNTRVNDYDGVLGTSAFADGMIQLLYETAKFRVSSLPDTAVGSAAVRTLYTMGLQGRWSSAKPTAGTEFSRNWQNFYLIDGLIVVPGRSDGWKEGLYVLDIGTSNSWILSRKTPTHYPAALSGNLRVGFRNEFGLESVHAYRQRTNRDTEDAGQDPASIAAVGVATAVLASQKLDSAYLANQTGVSFKGIIGAMWAVRLDLSIDYHDRILRFQEDKGMGFQTLTMGANHVTDEDAARPQSTIGNLSSELEATDIPVGIEPKD